MKRFTAIMVVVVICLVSSVFFAGCSDSSKPTNPQNATLTTTAGTSLALYSAGDIIKNPASGSAVGVLIIRYDAAADSYERAYIYPNSDGSWGYRMDDKTVTVSRANIEKIYTKKISSVSVSSVRIGTPTTIPVVTEATGTTTTATTATTVTATTTTGYAPRVTDIEPAKGTAGTTVSITALEGQNFVSGVNVSLKKSSTTITATNVIVDSSSLLRCTIAIPAGTDGGYWDVIVTNPDKQYHQYKNGFLVIESDTTATTTTTTTTTASATVTNDLGISITAVSPTLFTATGGATTLIITGTNLGYVKNMIVVKDSVRLPATTFAQDSISQVTARFVFPAGYTGSWTLYAVDSSGNYLAVKTDAFTTQ
jgi:hypothetical protein